MTDCEHCGTAAKRKYCDPCYRHKSRHGELPGYEALEKRFRRVRGETGRGNKWWTGTEWQHTSSVETVNVDISSL